MRIEEMIPIKEAVVTQILLVGSLKNVWRTV